MVIFTEVERVEAAMKAAGQPASLPVRRIRHSLMRKSHPPVKRLQSLQLILHFIKPLYSSLVRLIDCSLLLLSIRLL